MQMQKFNTIEALATAYKNEYNKSYAGQPHKHFTTDDVKDVCLVKKSRPDMLAKFGVTVDSSVIAIEHFGYVS